MRIVLVGPGAMGCLFAGFLAKSGAEVWLLDKDKARAKTINQQGIKVEGISGNWQVKTKATDSPQDIGKADLVIICVKSYDTKKAIMHAESLVADKTQILTLQNGVGNIEIMGEVIDADKVIGGTTSQGATLLGTGLIRHAGKGETVIGRIDGKITPALRQIEEILNKCGFPTKTSEDIKGLLWSKLIINVGINALTAITRLNNGRLIEFSGTQRILNAAATEAIEIAKKKGIKLIYDDPIAKVEAVCKATAGNVSSMLQDVLKKKRTEIDFINGVIVSEGQQLGIPTPVNSVLTDLVKTIEASYNLAVH